MRIPASSQRRRDEASAMMTPLIDVVFQLIIFFLWTASFQIPERELPSDVSQMAATGAGEMQEPPPVEVDFDALVVRIAWIDGAAAWRLGETPLASLDELRNRLSDVAAITRDVPVIVDPDPEAPIGVVIEAYDVVRLAGFAKAQLAASEAY